MKKFPFQVLTLATGLLATVITATPVNTISCIAQETDRLQEQK